MYLRRTYDYKLLTNNWFKFHNMMIISTIYRGRVVQLDRISDFGSEG